MAAKRRAPAKKKAAPKAKKSAGSNPKFGSPAWFAKYPKAARTAKRKGKPTTKRSKAVPRKGKRGR